MNKLSWYNIEPIKMPDDVWYDISDNQLKAEFPQSEILETCPVCQEIINISESLKNNFIVGCPKCHILFWRTK